MSKHQIQPECGENEQADTRREGQIRLTKPDSQARTGTRKIFPVQLTTDRIGKLTRLICTQWFVMTSHAYIYTVGCTLNSRLLSGHLGFVAGTLRGSLFPVCYGSVGVQLTRLHRLNQGTLTSICVRKNLNATVLQVTRTREFFYSCTGISRRGKTCPYSTALVVLIFCI